MDLTVISTYRCNAKCSTCFVWQNPTHPAEEISLATLKKLPSNIDHLNITGGEPTLREDLLEMVEILYPKVRKLEISSNGLLAERLEPVVKKYPDIKIRFSLEGSEQTNNRIRGETDGYRRKVEGLKRLKALGGRDLGFAMVIQDDNLDDVLAIYRLTQQLGVELATSSLHNGYQFHKGDNVPYDRVRVAREIEKLITEMLKSRAVKNWFRAYMNLGLIQQVLGHKRLIPCSAATNFIFVDPWSDVFACNIRPDLCLGNLEKQTFAEIYHSPQAAAVRQKVAGCQNNCWFVASARTAMRSQRFATLPKLGPLAWVLVNKLRVSLGKPVQFEAYVDYSRVPRDADVPRRTSFLGVEGVQRRVQRKDEEHYKQVKG